MGLVKLYSMDTELNPLKISMPVVFGHSVYRKHIAHSFGQFSHILFTFYETSFKVFI